MGSVQTNINCPSCKSENCIEDYYYKSDEIYIFCQNCGYHKEIFIKQDEKGKYLKDENDNYIYETIEEKGKGIVSFSKTEGIATIYSIPFDEKEKKDFLEELEKYKKENPEVIVEINHYGEI